MEGCYDVASDGRTVGRVHVERQGLYLRFECRCQMPERGMFRLVIDCGGHAENLGILMPDGRLATRIPAKRIGAGELRFRLLPKDQPWERKFIPVVSEEPFAYLMQLGQAALEVHQGQVGVTIDL